MPSPVENINTIRAYWSQMAKWRDSPSFPQAYEPFISAYYYGVRAMKELVDQCANNQFTRTDVFARSSVFEQCLVADPASEVARRSLLAVGAFTTATMLDADSGGRALREIMLDGIYKAGNGGFFSQKDPSGLTSWLNSVSVAAGGAAGVIVGDTNPGAVASLLKIIRDLALPVFWLSFLTNQRAFATLDSRLSTTIWSSTQASDLASRVTLKALSAAAAGRVSADLARLAQATLPVFPTGDGSNVATTPAPPKSWYRRGDIWGGIGVGLLTGGAVAQSRK